MLTGEPFRFSRNTRAENLLSKLALRLAGTEQNGEAIVHRELRLWSTPVPKILNALMKSGAYWCLAFQLDEPDSTVMELL